MALSGTLDTFELPDVLRLLASTAKTGRLRITGDRGSGSVWVQEGQVVATELTTEVAPTAPSDEEAVFGMLRFSAGSFSFESEASVADGVPRSLEPILGTAEGMLVEWRSIEAVVPSLSVWVTLTPELTGPDVMIDADRWRSIAAIGSGAEVAVVADVLEQGEMDACRTVKELIELGVVEISERPTEPEPFATPDLSESPFDAAALAGDDDAMVDEPVGGESLRVSGEDAEDHGDVEIHGDDVEIDGDENETAHDGPADEAAIDEPGADEFAPLDAPLVPTTGHHNGLDAPTGPDDESLDAPNLEDDAFTSQLTEVLGSDDDAIVAAEPALASLGVDTELDADMDAEVDDPPGDPFGGATDAEVDADDLDPAEMARQLANLSPKAAKAVAAAAKASTPAERDAALAAVEAEDDSVNRGLLLKFLGSVES